MPGFKDFVSGTPLTESDLDDYLGKQVVMKFASAAARDAALAAVLRDGMIAYLDDVDYYTARINGAWVGFGETDDVQVYTTGTGTWTKPSGAQTVWVVAIAPGGPGGSGRRTAAGTDRTGGTGGGGGEIVRACMPASVLSATETWLVSAAGAVGAAITVDNNNGLNGTNSGNTSFGVKVIARGGQAGLGGTGATLSGGSSGIGNSLGTGGSVGSAPVTGNAGGGGFDSSVAAGGAGGGGVTAANANVNGALGGATSAASGGAGGTAGVAGGVGGSTTPSAGMGGAGGGGGGGNAAGVGGNGGAGGNYGGGGGGGAGCVNGFNSGGGGAGGAGLLIVITTRS